MSTSKNSQAKTQKEQTIAQAITNLDRNKASIAKGSSNPFAQGISAGGRVSSHTRITLDGEPQAIKDGLVEIKVRTDQVHKILGYVTELGGTATVAEIDVFCQTATGNLVWGYNEIDLYNQKPSKVLRTYIQMMQGLKPWGTDGNKGTLKVVTVS